MHNYKYSLIYHGMWVKAAPSLKCQLTQPQAPQQQRAAL